MDWCWKMKVRHEMKSWIFLLALMSVLGVTSVSTADPGGLMGTGPEDGEPGPEMGMHKGMMKIMLKNKVGLNDEQIDSIQKLKYKADEARIDIEYKIKKERLELQRLMDGDKPDKARILKQLDKLGVLNTQAMKNRIGLMLDIRALMTPQQWEKMEQLHREKRKMHRRRKMRRRAGRMGHGGPMGSVDPMGMDQRPEGP